MIRIFHNHLCPIAVKTTLWVHTTSLLRWHYQTRRTSLVKSHRRSCHKCYQSSDTVQIRKGNNNLDCSGVSARQLWNMHHRKSLQLQSLPQYFWRKETEFRGSKRVKVKGDLTFILRDANNWRPRFAAKTPRLQRECPPAWFARRWCLPRCYQ